MDSRDVNKKWLISNRMASIYLNSFYCEILTFSKLRFSKSQMFLFRSIGFLQALTHADIKYPFQFKHQSSGETTV